MSEGIKDLLTEETLNKISVDGSGFSATMKKKTLTCITKMLNFYQEARGVLDKEFSLFKEQDVRLLMTLVKARSQRLDKESKEQQTINIVDEMRDVQERLPPMRQVFNACDQQAVKNILKDIVRVGRAVAEGSVAYVCKRSCTDIRDITAKMRVKPKITEVEAAEEEEEEEEAQGADFEMEETGRKYTKVSVQQYRQALILAICCKNARRSQEIVKYRDLKMNEEAKDKGGELLLHFMQHKTSKNKKAAIAVVSGLVREALFYYVT